MTFNYITGRVADAFTVAGGARLGFFSGKVDNLLEDMQILKPTLFNTVPRLLNRIYTGMYSLEKEIQSYLYMYRYCAKHTSSTRTKRSSFPQSDCYQAEKP